MPFKNTAVKVCIVAWDTANNVGKTGDSGNITVRGVGDGTEYTPTDTPTEIDATNLPGVYTVDLTAAENNYSFNTIGGKSSTANIVIIPISWSNESQTGDAYAVCNSRLPAALESGNIPAVVKAQDNIDFGAAQKASITAAVPTVDQILAEIDSHSTQLAAILEDTGTTIPALINTGAGAGSILHTYTVTDSADGTPIDGVEVWVSTDAAGVNVVVSGYTNSSGVVTFMLDAGTYYFWRKRSGYNFTNPDQETVI